MVKIKDVKTFITCPGDVNLVVVRVDTNQDGLYGLGCATFTQRCTAVVEVIEEYLKPLVIGRDASEIQELWTLMFNNGYWRNGPVVNNAVSGIDMALWDIKGKMANMPVYDLIGGKFRPALTVYRYANGYSREEILEKVYSLREQNFNHIRLQYLPMLGHKQLQQLDRRPTGAKEGTYQDPSKYIREIIGLFELVREKVGFDVELIHDVHERVPTIDAVTLAKELESMKLYFLEDLFSTEQTLWYRQVRNACSTPIAHGELCVNPMEWVVLLQEQLIDFIRIHASMIGGFTPTIKLAHLAETYGIRTAWHGPSDMNPVGFAAQMHLGITTPNFGIQEWPDLGPGVSEVFDGMPEIKDGYAYINSKPGWGIEFNEQKAKKFGHKPGVVEWTQFRLTDGGLFTP